LRPQADVLEAGEELPVARLGREPPPEGGLARGLARVGGGVGGEQLGAAQRRQGLVPLALAQEQLGPAQGQLQLGGRPRTCSSVKRLTRSARPGGAAASPPPAAEAALRAESDPESARWLRDRLASLRGGEALASTPGPWK
jgi:hypothetical protein